MKKSKKILSLVLAVIMIVCTVPMAYAEGNTYKYKVGDIIQFGLYPQSEIREKALVAELNSLAPEWDDWISYGYYSDSSKVQGDWMRYTDITYNGNKYRGVKFTQYRPYYTSQIPSQTHQCSNFYFIDTTYWFKFEPIDWRVLDPTTGFVMCETIIDSQPYSNTVYYNSSVSDSRYIYFNDDSYTNYASDYETSSIRQWLNNDFYNTAFTDSEKKEISTTTLNNDGYYTSVGTTGYEKLDSNETNDKIFLLSYNEVRNSNLGFNSSSSRRAQGSDYAKCQGLIVAKNSTGTYNGTADWFLRSPGDISNRCCSASSGTLKESTFVNDTSCGIRPALCLNDIETFYHQHSYNVVITNPTCTEQGYTTYTCECGDSYVANYVNATGHNFKTIVIEPTCTENGYTTYNCVCGETYTRDYSSALGHKYTSEITTVPTHFIEGVEIFTCACGDTYTQAIAKLAEHTYNAVITAPTCIEKGYTIYTCECGDSYIADYVNAIGHDFKTTVIEPTCTENGYTIYSCVCGETYTRDYSSALGHKYTSEITTAPTHLTVGVETFTCECGDSYTKVVEKIESHEYVSEVKIQPTHLTEGVETFTCACDDTYTQAIAKLAEHTYISEVTTQPTHLTLGVKTFTCECGDSYTEDIAKTLEHTFQASKITEPTCEKAGYTTYICACGDSYKDNFVAEKGHTYSGQMCTTCGKKCSCNCHKSGFMGFIWKITLFFNKLFKTKKVCVCGAVHY